MLTFHFEFEFYNDSFFTENITALQNKIGFHRKYPILLFVPIKLRVLTFSNRIFRIRTSPKTGKEPCGLIFPTK
ncbi:hypothetical protein CH380_08310 [Leptospira adleri]|uniref:Uncharacterized protein n=1 Tax=Leptospira adleri TaxID=2023186 RepID=A0A2M9YPY5_9LEPT|nr:hypothetical protein CH380_08310 [Leptospira adleri]PJZ61399.1 hypothetical protein CH376_13455 [Leptospira adleri]